MPPDLSEDAIDDIIYLARANESSDLISTLTSLAQSTGASAQDVLAAAVDAHSGSTALHMAAANGHTDLVKTILGYFPSHPTPPTAPAASTSSTSSPPSQPQDPAPVTPAPPTAFINHQNASGNTALHWAAVNGHLDAVKALVAAGAELEVRNKAGRDAVFEAEGAGKEEVVSWLLEVGAGREAEGKEEPDQSKEGAEVEVEESVEEGVERMGIEEKGIDGDERGPTEGA